MSHETLPYSATHDVLAVTRHGLRGEITFANRTQAENRAAKLRAEGVDAHAYKGIYRPFYVLIAKKQEAVNVT